MKEERDQRTVKLVGEAAMERLRGCRVAVIGCGGVGSYAAEALSRAGIGSITFMDGDNIALSNLNRQLVALTSTIGRNKAEVMAERARDINPSAVIKAVPRFYKSEEDLPMKEYDWIADAIDDVDAKCELIRNALKSGIGIVSAMGAAGKFHTAFKSADISDTSTCPLARVVRRRLRDMGIEHVPVVYSEEKPVPKDGVLGTISYVPGALGLELAGYIIRSITEKE